MFQFFKMKELTLTNKLCSGLKVDIVSTKVFKQENNSITKIVNTTSLQCFFIDM